MKQNPFLDIDQPDLVIIPMLQKLGPQILNVYMAVLWKPGGQTIISKRNTTIGYLRELDYVEKSPSDQ